MLREIVTRVSGQEFHGYLQENILDPLDIKRTVVKKEDGLNGNSSLAYSTLDTGEIWEVALPGMGSAGGLMSSANDLAKYHKVSMQCWNRQEDRGRNNLNPEVKNIFGDISQLFTPLHLITSTSSRENSYTMGWIHSHLPTSIGDIGINPSLIDKMPILADGLQTPRLAFWHQGSLVGVISFTMLLPETSSAVVVLSNSMGLNDVSDWIGQLLIETLVESPVRNDYSYLATLSASGALEKYEELEKEVEGGREAGGSKRDWNDYVGSYIGFSGLFGIDIRNKEDILERLFQGRESQRICLKHHHDDTFTWFMSWNQQIKLARFIEFRMGLYFVKFEEDGNGRIGKLIWRG